MRALTQRGYLVIRRGAFVHPMHAEKRQELRRGHTPRGRTTERTPRYPLETGSANTMHSHTRAMLNVAVLVTFSTLFCGACGDWPPAVHSKRDVERLSSTEQSIRARGLSDVEIPSLSRLINLQRIDFQGGWAAYQSRITDAGLAELAKLNLPNLEEMDLGKCPAITDAGLEQIGKIPTLTFLIIDENPNITHDGLLHLKELKNLAFLRLWACRNITDRAVDSISSITSLRELGLEQCSQITDAALPKLAELKNLRRLSLNGCDQLTDEGIQHLATKEDWELIDVSGCKQVTQDGVRRLQAALPETGIRKDEELWKHNVRTP